MRADRSMPAQKNIDFWVGLLFFCFREKLFVRDSLITKIGKSYRKMRFAH